MHLEDFMVTKTAKNLKEAERKLRGTFNREFTLQEIEQIYAEQRHKQNQDRFYGVRQECFEFLNWFNRHSRGIAKIKSSIRDLTHNHSPDYKSRDGSTVKARISSRWPESLSPVRERVRKRHSRHKTEATDQKVMPMAQGQGGEVANQTSKAHDPTRKISSVSNFEFLKTLNLDYQGQGKTSQVEQAKLSTHETIAEKA